VSKFCLLHCQMILLLRLSHFKNIFETLFIKLKRKYLRANAIKRSFKRI
jgi:hypothetical protein